LRDIRDTYTPYAYAYEHDELPEAEIECGVL
jgi:hypothetical protein